MRLKNENAELFIYEKGRELADTTHLCVAAHQDDIEIMAFAPIAECYGEKDKWFVGVTLTDGAGSPRNGIYKNCSDEEMKLIRKREQRTAGMVGGYLAQLQLGYSSAQIKSREKSEAAVCELAELLGLCRPQAVFTHNLADKHATHVAAALRTIEALKMLPAAQRPKKLIGLEVWRSLDWVCDESKLVLPTDKHENLACALLGVHDSQIAGGKRYDVAAVGRRCANATFFKSHTVDSALSASYGVDLTPLMAGGSAKEYIDDYICAFKREVDEQLDELTR